MYKVRLSPEELGVIQSSINQAQARLRGMKLRQALLPMQYCARLSWEALYEARQILRNTQTTTFREESLKQVSMEGIPPSELAAITQSIEQVMAQLQAIAASTDLSAMQIAVQGCLQQLDAVATGVKQPRLVLQK